MTATALVALGKEDMTGEWEKLDLGWVLGAHLSHSYIVQRSIHQMNLGIHLLLSRENMGEKVYLWSDNVGDERSK